MSQPTRHLSTDGEGCSTTHQPSRVVFAEQRRVAPEFGGPQEARFALELPGDAGQMDTPRENSRDESRQPRVTHGDRESPVTRHFAELAATLRRLCPHMPSEIR